MGTDTVRSAYQAVNRRDLDALVGMLHPTIELRMPMDPMRVHPVYRGHEGVRAFYTILFGAFEVYRAQLDTVRDLGPDVVVAVGRLVVRAAGQSAERTIRFSHFWELREGRVAHVAFHDADNPLALIHSGRPAVTAAAA